VLRVYNKRGLIKVKKLVDAWLKSLAPKEKGVIYYTSYIKYKALT
jgi:uncharacterized protein YeaO (DUF488 family)